MSLKLGRETKELLVIDTSLWRASSPFAFSSSGKGYARKKVITLLLQFIFLSLIISSHVWSVNESGNQGGKVGILSRFLRSRQLFSIDEKDVKRVQMRSFIGSWRKGMIKQIPGGSLNSLCKAPQLVWMTLLNGCSEMLISVCPKVLLRSC